MEQTWGPDVDRASKVDMFPRHFHHHQRHDPMAMMGVAGYQSIAAAHRYDHTSGLSAHPRELMHQERGHGGSGDEDDDGAADKSQIGRVGAGGRHGCSEQSTCADDMVDNNHYHHHHHHNQQSHAGNGSGEDLVNVGLALDGVGADGWDAENEHLVRRLADEVQCKRWFHGRVAQKYQRIKTAFQVCAAILTLVAGVLLVQQDTTVPWRLITGIVNILVSTFGLAIVLLDTTQVIDSHNNAFFAWHALHFYLWSQLSIPSHHRQPPSVLLSIAVYQYRVVQEQSPAVPAFIIRDFTQQCSRGPAANHASSSSPHRWSPRTWWWRQQQRLPPSLSQQPQVSIMPTHLHGDTPAFPASSSPILGVLHSTTSPGSAFDVVHQMTTQTQSPGTPTLYTSPQHFQQSAAHISHTADPVSIQAAIHTSVHDRRNPSTRISPTVAQAALRTQGLGGRLGGFAGGSVESLAAAATTGTTTTTTTVTFESPTLRSIEYAV